MSAFLVVDIEVTDPETYARYVEQVPEVVYRHGGRYVARSDLVVPLSGGWNPDRVIIIEFPDMDHLVAFGSSPEYRALATLRETSTRTRSIALQGRQPPPVPRRTPS